MRVYRKTTYLRCIKNKQMKNVFILFALSLLAVSCSKQVEQPPVPDQNLTTTIFAPSKWFKIPSSVVLTDTTSMKISVWANPNGPSNYTKQQSITVFEKNKDSAYVATTYVDFSIYKGQSLYVYFKWIFSTKAVPEEKVVYSTNLFMRYSFETNGLISSY